MAKNNKSEFNDLGLGKMRGAMRVSVGLATNLEDLDQFIEFAKAVELELQA